jgi:hypothetical protein
MSDITLSNGREFEIDLYQISLAEFRNLLDPDRPNEEGDDLIGRCIGMTGAEVAALPYPDYRLLVKVLMDKARNPLASPNSASAFSSD